MWNEVGPPTPTQIRDAFGVDVSELRPRPCGFEADAFTDGRWFVKLWRQQPDSDAALALTGGPTSRSPDHSASRNRK
jgi:spectinomycin phosphotransferase